MKAMSEKRAWEDELEPPAKRAKRMMREGFIMRASQVGPIHAADWANTQFALGALPVKNCFGVSNARCEQRVCGARHSG